MKIQVTPDQIKTIKPIFSYEGVESLVRRLTFVVLETTDFPPIYVEKDIISNLTIDSKGIEVEI